MAEDKSPEEKKRDLKTTEVLYYPFEKSERYGACITFHPKKIVSPEIDGTMDEESQFAAAMAGVDRDNATIDRDNESSDKKLTEEQIKTLKDQSSTKWFSKGNKLNKGLLQSTKTATNLKMKLYLPAGFTTTDGLSYSNVDIGPLGATALNQLSGGSSLTSMVGNALATGVKSVGDLFAGNIGGNDLGKLAAVRGAQSILGKAMPEELRNAVTIAAGVTINPNTRAMFKGVALREFQFQFKFIPRSEAEAKEVEAIIYRFRHMAYPESLELDGGVSAGYKYPNMFSISLDYDNGDGGEPKPIGTKIKDCYLKSISTNYNPSSMSYHSDGRPVEYDLTLSFSEDVALNKTDIEEGY
jgi:hypothetical protein